MNYSVGLELECKYNFTLLHSYHEFSIIHTNTCISQYFVVLGIKIKGLFIAVGGCFYQCSAHVQYCKHSSLMN